MLKQFKNRLFELVFRKERISHISKALSVLIEIASVFPISPISGSLCIIANRLIMIGRTFYYPHFMKMCHRWVIKVLRARKYAFSTKGY